MEKPVAREELCSWIWPLKGVCVRENEGVSTTETKNKQARKGMRDER